MRERVTKGGSEAKRGAGGRVVEEGGSGRVRRRGGGELLGEVGRGEIMGGERWGVAKEEDLVLAGVRAVSTTHFHSLRHARSSRGPRRRAEKRAHAASGGAAPFTHRFLGWIRSATWRDV